MLLRSFRTSFASPTMLAFVGMFLSISAASISICMIFAFGANLDAFPITRSENLAPTTITRSALDTPRLDTFVPCIPIMPVYLSLLPSNAPLPISVSHTGASTLSANSASSADASEMIHPPPAMINGLLETLIISRTLFTSSSRMVSVFLSMTSGVSGIYSVSAAVTSFVISTSTGPGLPLFAILNARLMVGARSSMCFTIKLCLVIGITTPAMSTSWKLSLPSIFTPTFAVIATTGMESMYAVAIPVTRLVAPGPDVAIHTPTLPVALAYPSAAWAAPCSCDVSTWLISSWCL